LIEPRTREQINEIVEIQVAMVIRRVRERGIEVELTDAARTLLGNLGYDPTYGARPLKRVIQRSVQDPLAEMILAGEVKDGDRVVISEKGNVLTFNGQVPKTAEVMQFDAPVPKRKLN